MITVVDVEGQHHHNYNCHHKSKASPTTYAGLISDRLYPNNNTKSHYPQCDYLTLRQEQNQAAEENKVRGINNGKAKDTRTVPTECYVPHDLSGCESSHMKESQPQQIPNTSQASKWSHQQHTNSTTPQSRLSTDPTRTHRHLAIASKATQAMRDALLERTMMMNDTEWKDHGIMDISPTLHAKNDLYPILNNTMECTNRAGASSTSSSSSSDSLKKEDRKRKKKHDKKRKRYHHHHHHRSKKRIKNQNNEINTIRSDGIDMGTTILVSSKGVDKEGGCDDDNDVTVHSKRFRPRHYRSYKRRENGDILNEDDETVDSFEKIRHRRKDKKKSK